VLLSQAEAPLEVNPSLIRGHRAVAVQGSRVFLSQVHLEVEAQAHQEAILPHRGHQEVNPVQDRAVQDQVVAEAAAVGENRK
jgi:hypothetical protein